MKKMLMMAAVCLMAAVAFAAQCAATTKKGTQCKRQASPGSEFCWQHGGTTKAERSATGESEAPRRAPRRVERDEAPAEAEAPAARPRRRPRPKAETVETPQPVAEVAEGLCQATTKKGTPCKRKAQGGGKYCAQHAALLGEGEASAPVSRPKRKAAKAERTEPAPAAEAEPAADGICQGKTKGGEPCKRKAKPGSKFCWQHDK